MPNEKGATAITSSQRTKGGTFQRISNQPHHFSQLQEPKASAHGQVGFEPAGHTSSSHRLHRHRAVSPGTLNKHRELHTEVI